MVDGSIRSVKGSCALVDFAQLAAAAGWINLNTNQLVIDRSIDCIYPTTDQRPPQRQSAIGSSGAQPPIPAVQNPSPHTAYLDQSQRTTGCKAAGVKKAAGSPLVACWRVLLGRLAPRRRPSGFLLVPPVDCDGGRGKARINQQSGRTYARWPFFPNKPTTSPHRKAGKSVSQSLLCCSSPTLRWALFARSRPNGPPTAPLRSRLFDQCQQEIDRTKHGRGGFKSVWECQGAPMGTARAGSRPKGLEAVRPKFANTQ